MVAVWFLRRDHLVGYEVRLVVSWEEVAFNRCRVVR